MSRWNEENELDNVFQSMNKKFDLSKEEKSAIQTEVNRKIVNRPPQRINRSTTKYYLSLSAAVILFSLLAIPTILTWFMESSPQLTANEMLAVIKEELELGMTEEEVTTLLGTNYQEVVAAMDDSRVWRYDVETAEGYQNTAVDDFVDMEGLMQGDIKMQLFITWGENGKVRTFSSIYQNKTDGNIYNFRVYSDNTREDVQIYPLPETENDQETNDDIEKTMIFEIENLDQQSIASFLATNSIEMAEWAPDEGKVAFAYPHSDENTIESQMYIWLVGEREPRVIEDVTGYRITDFYWSPNSQYVFVSAGTSAIHEGLIVSTESFTIYAILAYMSMHWSPDSSKIALGIMNDSVQPVVDTELSGSVDLAVYHLAEKLLEFIEVASEEYYFSVENWEEMERLTYRKIYFDYLLEGETLEINPIN
ncbi:MAG: hypothetical protein LRY73_09265 [Bacillus sp. (in: Bacteria)]|nr:hypothetical protein [Bacillus sp. (in: firmicutes)]